MSGETVKPKTETPSFVRRGVISHKQEKREMRASYRQFVNRFKKVKKGPGKEKGIRQTPATLGFLAVLEIGRIVAGKWSGDHRMVKRPVGDRAPAEGEKSEALYRGLVHP